MSVLSEYKDSSRLTTYPKPLTDHAFAGLNEQENIDFKIWLGLIGENEIEIADDQKLELYFVNAFKEQKDERCQHMNPAQKTSLISFWFLQAAADKFCAGLRHGCEFWQLDSEFFFSRTLPAKRNGTRNKTFDAVCKACYEIKYRKTTATRKNNIKSTAEKLVTA